MNRVHYRGTCKIIRTAILHRVHYQIKKPPVSGSGLSVI
jgi:hypothetical protein